jgi:thiol-disulfide isomerase/thioredoxin
MTNTIYTELNIENLKEILSLVDDNENKDNVAIIIKFGADWCGPCNRIMPYCHNIFKKYPEKIICFDIDIDNDKNLELYLAYKQKKMVTSIPVIFAYVTNSERDKNHWWVPDFSVNSAKQHDLDSFFAKVNTLTT